MSLSTNPRVRLAELRERWDTDRRSRVFLQLAEEYRRQGQPSDAIGVLEVGLSHNPSSIAGQVALGRCLLELQRMPEARDVLEAVLSKDATQMVAYRHLIDVHLALGESRDALRRFEIYEQLNPLDPELPEIRARLQAAEPSISSGEEGEAEGEPGPRAESESEVAEVENEAAASASGASEETDQEPLRAGVSPTAQSGSQGDDPAVASADEADESAEGHEAGEIEAPDDRPTATLRDRPRGEHPGPEQTSALPAQAEASAAEEVAGSEQGSDQGSAEPLLRASSLADPGASAPRWGEIFSLPTDLAASRLRFGPLQRRPLRGLADFLEAPSAELTSPETGERHSGDDPTAQGRSAPSSTLADLYRSQGHPPDAVQSDAAHAAVERASAPRSDASVEERAPDDQDRRGEAGAVLPPAPVEHLQRSPEGEASAPPSAPPLGPVVSPPPDLPPARGTKRLDASAVLSLYAEPHHNLEMMPKLQRKRHLVNNYLRGLRALREGRK